MFKTLVTKVAKDLWDNAGKPAAETPAQQEAAAPASAVTEQPVTQANVAAEQPVAQAEAVHRRPETDIEFPYYPGEGTECGATCRCRWDVQVRWRPADNSNATFASWVTAGDGNVCPD